jgi:uncharacterized protein
VPNTLVTDTSVLYAALDPSDAAHEASFSLLESGAAVTVTAPVIAETDWLARTRGRRRATELLLESVVDGSVLVVDLDGDDYRRIRTLVERHADLPLDLVDASVVAIAERLEQHTIATLDRRHFSIVKPFHVDSFTIVP